MRGERERERERESISLHSPQRSISCVLSTLLQHSLALEKEISQRKKRHLFSFPTFSV
jgi:hypothetical protein